MKEDEVVFVESKLIVAEFNRKFRDLENDESVLMDKYCQVESSIERLDAIVNTITKYGICAPIMEAADPRGELIAAGAINGSYEELETVPVKDEKAAAAIESLAILGFAMLIGAAIYHFFKFISGKLSKKIETIGEFITASEPKLKEISAKFSDSTVEFDEDRFANYEVWAYSKPDFQKLISINKSVNKILGANFVADNIKKINDMISSRTVTAEKVKSIRNEISDYIKPIITNEAKELYGILVDYDDNKNFNGVVFKSGDSHRVRNDAGKLGWKISDIKTMVDITSTMIEASNLKDSTIDHLNSEINAFVRTISKNNRDVDQLSKDEKLLYKDAIRLSKELLDLYWGVCEMLKLTVVSGVDATLNVSQAAWKCRK